jgi:hypothetical protein
MVNGEDAIDSKQRCAPVPDVFGVLVVEWRSVDNKQRLKFHQAVDDDGRRRDTFNASLNLGVNPDDEHTRTVTATPPTTPTTSANFSPPAAALSRSP